MERNGNEILINDKLFDNKRVEIMDFKRNLCNLKYEYS